MLLLRITHHVFFFYNKPATTELIPLPPHTALPLPGRPAEAPAATAPPAAAHALLLRHDALVVEGRGRRRRSEEHTSELQSHLNLVCRLLLEKKITNITKTRIGVNHVRSASQVTLSS